MREGIFRSVRNTPFSGVTDNLFHITLQCFFLLAHFVRLYHLDGINVQKKMFV